MTKNDAFAQRMVGFALDRGWKPNEGDLAPFMERMVVDLEKWAAFGHQCYQDPTPTSDVSKGAGEALQCAAERLRKIAQEPYDVEYSGDFCAGWDAAVELEDFAKDTEKYTAFAPHAVEMYEALKAYEALENHRMNCKECEDRQEMAAETCAACFPFADDARCKIRAVIARIDAPKRSMPRFTKEKLDAHKDPPLG